MDALSVYMSMVYMEIMTRGNIVTTLYVSSIIERTFRLLFLLRFQGVIGLIFGDTFVRRLVRILVAFSKHRVCMSWAASEWDT